MSDSPSLAHELRNTLSAVDMLLESAIEELDGDGDPLEPIKRARQGVAEAIDLVARDLEP